MQVVQRMRQSGNVYDPTTLQPIGCCRAVCRIWWCQYIWGGYCENDIDFDDPDPQTGQPRVWYYPNQCCSQNSGGYPMQGTCQQCP